MDTRLTQVIWLILLMPLAAVLTVPLVRRINPRYQMLGTKVFYGLAFVHSFFLLLCVAEGSHILTHQVALGRLQVGFYVDSLTAATLIIVSAVSLQTVISNPKIFANQQGLVSLGLFCLSTLSLMALLLSDSLLLFLLFWIVLDFGVFYGHHLTPSRSIKERWRVFWFLQSASALVCGAVVAMLLVFNTTSFVDLISYAHRLNAPILTWVLAFIFLGVGVKTAGFPYSFWSPLALFAGSNLPAFPLIYGIGAVLPGIYLLTRLHPLFPHTIIPIPLILLVAVLLGFALFPLVESLALEGNEG